MVSQADAQRRLPRPEARSAPVRAQRLVVLGSLLGALAASSCCILPLALFGVGISGAWIGNLTRLSPYQPYFLAVSSICLGYGYWLVQQSRKGECADGRACARPLPNRVVELGLVLATILVIGALGFDVLAPLILQR